MQDDGGVKSLRIIYAHNTIINHFLVESYLGNVLTLDRARLAVTHFFRSFFFVISVVHRHMERQLKFLTSVMLLMCITPKRFYL